MRARRIGVTRRVDAPPDAVWALLSDVGTWTRWGPWETADLERPGRDRPQGVGAVRRLRAGRWTLRELVEVAEAPRRLRYRLLSGMPVRDYVADVRLAPAPDGGTELTWSARFAPRVPGTGRLLARRLTALLGDISSRLAAFAENPDPGRRPGRAAMLHGRGPGAGAGHAGPPA